MKKILISLLLVSVMLFGVSAVASAEEYTGEDDWKAVFDGEKFTANFESAEISDVLEAMQPGDTATFTVTLESTAKDETDFWMSSKVLGSFEDGTAAENGAYTYRLAFSGASGSENVLFDSETVGGDDADGLHGATDALEEFFFLDTFKNGDSGVVTLEITLDGETQGNSYQDTFADLQMNFAAEPRGTAPTPKTGDQTNLLLLMGAVAVSGLVLLVIAIVRVKRSRKSH